MCQRCCELENQQRIIAQLADSLKRSDPDPDTFADILREAIRTCGKSRYKIAIETGVSQSRISAFMHGGTMLLSTFTRLAIAVGLDLVKSKE
jgi:hypothetical protein